MPPELSRVPSPLSVTALLRPGSPWRRLAPALDWCLGIRQLRRAYEQHQCSGLSPRDFAERALTALGVSHRGGDELLAQVPRRGSALLVANHPFGALEGILLIALLAGHRSDVRILANRSLAVVPELKPLFIFTDPMTPGAPGNPGSIRACHQHLAQGGLLVVFPAGRVSQYQAGQARVADDPWHRLAGKLARDHTASVVPLFIAGGNSASFHRLGRLHPRLRLLLLARELLKARGREVALYPGRCLDGPPEQGDARSDTHWYRWLCYAQDPAIQGRWPVSEASGLEPVAPPAPADALARELAQLPAEQCLLEHRGYRVYYAEGEQIPQALHEIRRLREATFRHLDEGSGRPWDGDDFDLTYTHLFVYAPVTGEIIGAYRMGRSDRLLKESGMDGLYLNQIFDFPEDFINRHVPCLELGRSFIVPDYQRSFAGLLLLFKGIGVFLCRFPQYRHLYGTVSLTTQYRPLSVHVIERALATDQPQVRPLTPLSHPPAPELDDYLRAAGPLSLTRLDDLISQLEPDAKGLPVLLRQYAQLGARFHGVGIDHNFANTPGLLLSVAMDEVPEKRLKRFLGNDAAEAYRNRT